MLVTFQVAAAFYLGDKALAVGFSLLFAIVFGYLGMLIHRSFHFCDHWLE
jgi:hypothetical protein